MFETKIEEDTLFATTWAHSERDGETRNYLKAISEVIGPANSRADKKTACPLYCIRSNDLLAAVKHCLQENIEPGLRQPDKALAEVIAKRCPAVSCNIF